MLAAVNGLFRFLGWGIRVKFLKVQRRLFRDQSRELTRGEYDMLVNTDVYKRQSIRTPESAVEEIVPFFKVTFAFSFPVPFHSRWKAWLWVPMERCV